MSYVDRMVQPHTYKITVELVEGKRIQLYMWVQRRAHMLHKYTYANVYNDTVTHTNTQPYTKM